MIVLGIESSCDETSASICQDGKIRSNVIRSQAEIHRLYGGVVPEIASRNHLVSIISTIALAVKDGGLTLNECEGVAATHAPGLIGSLLIGLSAGKALSYSRNIPFLGVNHLEAHLLSPMIENKDLEFPFLGLVVSGGHTLLVDAIEFGRYSILGQTLDDAAGEAFDKVAKLLGFAYPGGAVIDRLARKGKADAIAFPRPLVNSSDFHFSFSGLKTSVVNHLRKAGSLDDDQKADIAASFQEAVADVLTRKTERAIRMLGYSRVCLCGGVAANSRIQDGLRTISAVKLYLPSIQLCTDNAAMIAYTGECYLKKGYRHPLSLSAQSNVSLQPSAG